MDPITDMFNRIKNAQMVGHEAIQAPFSEVKSKIAEILKAEGFILDCKKRGRGGQKVLGIVLKYDSQRKPAMENFKRISKPGQRIYKSFKDIRKVKSGYGLSIVSTSQGIMTDKEARQKKVGGEVMVEVW